jgi:hypothetical protein
LFVDWGVSFLPLVLAAWASGADFRAPKPVVLPLAVPAAAGAPSLPTISPPQLSPECARAQSVDKPALPSIPPAALPAALPAAAPTVQDLGSVTEKSGPAAPFDALRGLGAELAKPGRQAAAIPAALSAAFDGSSKLRAPVATSGERAPIDLGAVAAQNPLHAARLREIIAAAKTTKTGRGVMRRAEALARRRGPVPVSFAPLGDDLGAFEYMEGRMVLSRSLLSRPPAVAAATLVHELVHVLQHAEGLPAEALELELEAHMLTLEFLDEAGLKPDSPFSRAARLRLELGPLEFYGWMATQLPSKYFLRFSSPEDIADQLEEDYDKFQERLEKIPATAKNRHRREKLERLSRWTLSDLELIRTPEGLAAYRALARRVHARAKRLSAKYAADPLKPAGR